MKLKYYFLLVILALFTSCSNELGMQDNLNDSKILLSSDEYISIAYDNPGIITSEEAKQLVLDFNPTGLQTRNNNVKIMAISTYNVSSSSGLKTRVGSTNLTTIPVYKIEFLSDEGKGVAYVPADERFAKIMAYLPKTDLKDSVKYVDSMSMLYLSELSLLEDAKYYSHFTISMVTREGTLQLLNYDEGDIDMGGGATWSNLLKNGTALDEGNYMLVTGTRLANGGVLSDITFFTIKPGETTTVDLVMRESKDDVQVIGNFNSESLYKPIDSDELKSILSTTGRGYYIVAVLGAGQEPTNHALRDIAALSKDFEQWGRSIVLLFPNEEQFKKFRPEEFPGLPSTITYGIDADGAIQKQIAEGMKLPNKTILPMFIIGDTFNRVVFVSQGYTIGLGEQLMKVIHKL